MNAPQQISHYRIIKPLGAGGMGEVYLAEDSRLGRPVALKLLPSDLASDGKRLRRFLQEAKLASSLNHPNVCTIYEVGETPEGQPFIAMEYIEGQTLSTKINGQPLTLADTLQFAIEIADALSEAHSKGIIHRDLKPANVLISKRDQAKVLDFGLAKLTNPVAPSAVGEMPTQPQTDPGTVMGTPPYMSPEQALGKEADLRTDLFSLGVVVYEMATGRLPFTGATVTEMLDRIVHAQPEAIARFNYNAPAELERIIRKCLEKERERRYQSARELLVDLKNLKRDTDSGSNQPRAYDPGIGFAPAAKASAPNALRTTVMESSPGWRKGVTWQRKAGIGLLLALLVGGLVYGLFWRKPAVAPQPEIKSLAILPLENLSGDPAQEYFADGLTEALISNLAQIRALRVISRTSVMRYKGSGKSLPEIARELNVDAVIEGSVQRAGGRVRITAQLIRAATDTHLWARDYEREMADVLKLESEVARTVADEIRIQVTPEERRRLASSRSVNPQAQEAYLQGRYHLRNLNEYDLSQAIKYFEIAIQFEPDYAAAYAGLASAWQERGTWGEKAFKDVEAPARSAALKAVDLDSDNAEARTALAQLKFIYGWDFDGAEREFTRALELDPGSPTAHHYYAILLMALGRHSEAIGEMESAVRLNPFSSIMESTFGRILYRAQKNEEAIAHLKQAINLDPQNYTAYIRLGDVYAKMGKYNDALEMFKQAGELRHGGYHQARSARVYALMGKPREARQMVSGMKADAFDLAGVYAALGDKDQAFRILEKAIDARDSLLVFIKEDPTFENLHSDPRWKMLLRRMNFPLK